MSRLARIEERFRALVVVMKMAFAMPKRARARVCKGILQATNILIADLDDLKKAIS